MRTSTTITIVFGALFSSVAALPAAINLLADPSLDMSTPDSQTNPVWSLVANQPDGAQFSAQFQNAPWASNPNGVDGIGLWLKPFEGAQAEGDPLANATISQTVPAMAGLTYNFTLWHKQETNYTAGSTFFALDFLDSTGSVISTEEMALTHPKDASWLEYTISVVAPTDAADVTVRAGMLDGMDAMANPQSAMFDDFSLEAIPEPSSALLSVLALGALLCRRRRP